MKERPILFSGEMVRAILDGRKTQTRRIVKYHVPGWVRDFGFSAFTPHGYISARGSHPEFGPSEDFLRIPFGQPGDRLWVRETFMHSPATYVYEASTSAPAVPSETVYAADFPKSKGAGWTPSIHMPRWASRITLEVTGIRVERLRSISPGDAICEGARKFDDIPQSSPGGDNRWSMFMPKSTDECMATPYGAFANAWVKIYGEDSWFENPWVWVIEFKRIEQQQLRGAA